MFGSSKRIQVRERKIITFVPVSGIFYLEFDNPATNICYEDDEGKKSILIYKRMSELLYEIDDPSFVRVHQCYVVNVTRVKMLQHDGQRGALTFYNLDEQETVPVSRGYKQKFYKVMADFSR